MFFVFVLQLLKLPSAVNVISVLEGYVKFCTANAVNVLTEKQVRSSRSQDDNSSVLTESKYVCPQVC
jgi:hypothetical protein